MKYCLLQNHPLLQLTGQCQLLLEIKPRGFIYIIYVYIRYIQRLTCPLLSVRYRYNLFYCTAYFSRRSKSERNVMALELINICFYNSKCLSFRGKSYLLLHLIRTHIRKYVYQKFLNSVALLLILRII